MGHKAHLAAEHLYFSYEKKGQALLHDLSVAFAAGEITALLGANGCGKSTLVKLLAGVYAPNSGCVRLDGQPLEKQKKKDVARRIAVVHQKNTAPADYTVKKLVAAGRTPYHGWFGARDRAADEAAVWQALEDTDTLHLAERFLSELSGGQLQRVWLAMALAQQTDILLLDELTTYLDVHYQLELLHFIRTCNRKRKTTIVMVLHDINLAFSYCDQAVVMKQGHILAQGAIPQVLTKEVLDEAFDVSARIFQQRGQTCCMFEKRIVEKKEKEELCG